METNRNIEVIARMVDYIEEHLEEPLELGSLAAAMGYSKYHLHRMFTPLVGFPVHTYIQRRRLTEAARQLVFSARPILEIALEAGYETQRSFSAGFKALFRSSPQVFRKKRDFLPLQLKYQVDGIDIVRGDRTMDIRFEESGKIILAGYKVNTARGFGGIPGCHHKLNKVKGRIPGRADLHTSVALNDYEGASFDGARPAFDYYAAVEVASAGQVSAGMAARVLEGARYVVFRFRGRNEDSMEPVSNYIYREWFPQSTCRMNEHAMYDFVKYGENVDEDGMSDIEYWVPIM